jgi:hypothetical protein
VEKNLKEKEISSLDIMFADYPQQYLDKHYEDLIKFYPNTKDFSLRLTFPNGVAIFRFHYIDFTKFKLLILDIDLTSDNNILIEFNDCQFNKICDVDNSSKNKFTEYELVFRFNRCSFKNESEIEFQTLFGHITNLIYKIKFEFFDIKRDRENREKVSIKIYDDETLIKIKLENIDIINSKIMGECLILDSLNTKISNTDFNKKIEIKNSDIEFENVDFSNEIELRNNSSIEVKKNSTIQNLVCSEGAKAIEINNCSIANARINGEITEKAIFNNVTFTNPPNIGDIKFKNCNVEFRDPDFKDKKTPEAIAGFRALNKACRDANYHHGEIFFHGLTLEGRGEELKYKSDFVERLLSDAYEVFSDFGRSVNRPLLWLLILGFIFFGINYYEINKINNLKLSENSVINKSIVENNNNFEEEQNQLNKINKKIVIRNAIGPLRIALPKDFIEDNEEKLFKEKINSDFIYFLNIIHAFLSLGIWSIWLFMIRARFKL